MFVEQGHIAIYKQLNNLLMELSAEVAMDQQIRFGRICNLLDSRFQFKEPTQSLSGRMSRV
jgi:hypothetical protein